MALALGQRHRSARHVSAEGHEDVPSQRRNARGRGRALLVRQLCRALGDGGLLAVRARIRCVLLPPTLRTRHTRQAFGSLEAVAFLRAGLAVNGSCTPCATGSFSLGGVDANCTKCAMDTIPTRCREPPTPRSRDRVITVTISYKCDIIILHSHRVMPLMVAYFEHSLWLRCANDVFSFI